MKKSPMAYKICQSSFIILHNTKYTLKKFPKNEKILPKGWNFAQSGHTALDSLLLQMDRNFDFGDADARSRVKRNALDSFTGFYLPKFGADAGNRLKRDLLKTFSSFYLPQAKQVD